MISLVMLSRKYNLFQVMRYGLVGVCAASAHGLVAMALFHLLDTPPTLSNFSGFISGAIISYLGSYYFTFKSEDGHGRSLPRFVLVWLIGIAINVGLFQTLLSLYAVPFALNVFIAVALTPIAQFLMLKFWAFKK
ncbi:MAG: GtrA family protein [Robiginitomaculum sp.]|nr:GtrA family protein [Robiginitomaculum sp.]